MIAIVDYDIGNLGAVANMLRRVGAEGVITADPAVIGEADRIILPGNGAFDACMRNLKATGLIPLLERRVADKVPLLGICVGAQMLGEGSDEGKEPGLGWLKMQNRRFPAITGLRVPHMGWNHVSIAKGEDPLVAGLPDQARFYFVHSYYLAPETEDDILLKAEYGLPFAAGVSQGNVAGVQFHPEKSHRFGMRLLANFAGTTV